MSATTEPADPCRDALRELLKVVEARHLPPGAEQRYLRCHVALVTENPLPALNAKIKFYSEKLRLCRQDTARAVEALEKLLAIDDDPERSWDDMRTKDDIEDARQALAKLREGGNHG